MIAARTAGMAFNELIDRKIDSANPRTQGRVLPTGQIKPITVSGLAWLSLGLFLMCCEKINSTLFIFALFPAAMIVIYSYTKRFTSLCHFFLAAIYLLIPLMTWVAITGGFSWIPLFLGIAQASCIAGSDIIYSIQDCDFDRSYGIYSLPSKLGIPRSLLIARVLHVLTVIALVVLGRVAALHPIYFVGVSVIAVMLFVQHLRGKEIFTCNVWVSFLILFSILGSLLWPV